MRNIVLLCTVLGILSASQPIVAADANTMLADELTLANSGLATDSRTLLDFFRKRTQTSVDAKLLVQLVKELGDANPLIREKAVAGLVGYGALSVPLLRQASKDVDDGDRVANARRCLQALEGPAASAVPIAAARILGQRRPSGVAEVLLSYLPQANDEALLEEIKNTLTVAACTDGRPDAALVKALEDPYSLRRAAAAEVLCQARGGPLPPALYRLLADQKPLVRLRVALALADFKDANAVAVLIDLLTQLPVEQARLAEDYLFALAEEKSPKVVLGANEGDRQKCRDAWLAWWRSNDGSALVEELRTRSLTDVDREKVQSAIQKLGDDAFDMREKAVTELIGMGAVVIPFLKKVGNDADLEVRQRAQRCIQQIGDKIVPLSPVTVRMLAYRKPAGAAEVLLNYLPFAEEENIVAEVQEALVDVATRDGKLEIAIERALKDKLPLRRAIAAEAVCWAGTRNLRDLARPLLKDPDSTVRSRAALALANTGDKEAVPVLIAALADLPRDQASAVEDFLARLAGAQAPEVPVGADAESRRKCRDAWADWYRQRGDNLQLAKTIRPIGVQRHLGYTLIVIQDQGQVQELDRQGKPRWQVTGLMSPYDAQVLPGNRILVAEYNSRRVTERNLKGEILWQKEANWPIGCQRLSNGNTFIVMRNQLIEADRTGKEVFNYNRNQYDISAARKMRDGHIVCVTSSSTCLWLDAAGKEVKNYRIGQVQQPASLQVLPNGNIIVPLMYQNKVAEYDSDGKSVWETTVQQPSSATRLLNGNTLICTQWPSRVFEADRAGKVVWEQKLTNRALKATRR